MLLSDIAALQRLSSTKQNHAQDSHYGDQYDPEIDRLCAHSPVMGEWMAAFHMQDMYEIVEKDTVKAGGLEAGQASNKLKELFGKPNPPNDLEKKDCLEGESQLSQNTFQPLTLSILHDKPSQSNFSGLTKTLEESKAGSKGRKSEFGKIKLTIYLPDLTGEMTVFARGTCKYSELLKIILDEHQDQDLDPPLNYGNPGKYEIRMHEGDGEPDSDFPPLPWDKKLGEYNLDEYCLCEKEIEKSQSGSSRRGTGNNSTMPGSDLLGSTSQFGSFPVVGTSGGASSSRTVARDREDSIFAYRQTDGIARPDSIADLSALGNDNGGSDNGDSSDEKVVTIRFPRGGEIEIPYEGDMTLKHLLPTILKSHKIQIYSDEYLFSISSSDQRMLRLMTPVVDVNVPIRTIGAHTFDIQKKVYADSARVAKASGGTSNLATVRVQREKSYSYTDGEGPFIFTEATANAYKEWNVVKRNKFGRRQERTFGVDGRKVYNSKRGQLKGNPTGVQRAERDMSTIVKIEILPGDNKTFRITWMDDKDIYNIEYTCETARDCAEIHAKIKFILNKLRVSKR